jgi:antibiotic biosynthesis monooxygenase (ABM) superfamily enzyme
VSSLRKLLSGSAAGENYCDFVSELTGPFDTSKLPRIAPGSVTVTIARTVKAGRSAEFNSWSEEMVKTVQSAPGCLGATMLHPGKESDEYHIVFRFIDALHLRQWERSPERNALLAKGDDLIKSERVTVTAGDDEFFTAQAQVAPHRTKFGGFLSEVAWVYPLALGFTVVLGPSLSSLSVFLRALIFTALIGLTSRLAVAPFRVRWHRRRMLPQDQRVQK